jgi:hypothetical protein
MSSTMNCTEIYLNYFQYIAAIWRAERLAANKPTLVPLVLRIRMAGGFDISHISQTPGNGCDSIKLNRKRSKGSEGETM